MRERTRPLVLKFGGTSVADAEAIGRLIRIVRPLHEQGTPVVLVVSAMSGVTDRLLALASAAERREGEAVSAGVAALASRHGDAMRALGSLDSAQWFEISSHFDERGLAMLAAVGDRLRTTPRIAARVIGVLGDFPVRIVSRAASRRNVTLVLSDSDVGSAMARLHEEFFDLAAPITVRLQPDARAIES